MSGTSIYSKDKYYPSNEFVGSSLIKPEDYYSFYEKSISNPELFWSELASSELNWFKVFDKVYEKTEDSYKWFINGKLNITYNCLDRHVVNGKGEKIAFFYENEERESKSITYAELLKQVNKLSNGLKSLNVNKGDVVTIYMPMTLEIIITMLACARIGAIHSVVFGGFSSGALRKRIEDTKSKIIFTGSYTKRRGKEIPLKLVVDEAKWELPYVEKCIVYRRDEKTPMYDCDIDFMIY